MLRRISPNRLTRDRLVRFWASDANVMQTEQVIEAARLPSLKGYHVCSYATDHVRKDVLKSSQVNKLEWAVPLLLPALASMYSFKHI